MKPAILYSRVSTTLQAEEGVSFSAQDAKLRAWCVANDYDVRGVFEDAGISGGKMTNRPGLNAALDAVTDVGGVLCVYSLSRLARSTKDAIAIAERLKKAGCGLVSLVEKLSTDSAIGEFFFTLIAALAQLERAMISERVSMALAHMRGQGKKTNHPQYGYAVAADGETLVEVAEEQAALGAMRQFRGEGVSLAAIAAHLTKSGIPSKLGRGWTAKTVSRILGRTA